MTPSVFALLVANALPIVGTVAEPACKLSSNTKKLLQKLKFFGDMGAHNRLLFVLKGDLETLHPAIRAGFGELATFLVP